MSDGSAATLSTGAMIMGRSGSIRRSTRHRKLRGEKALIVSASQTLKELKIQVLPARAPGSWFTICARLKRCT